MAKGLKTRQKLVYRADGLRPRNPLALAARKPAAGARGPAAGGLRRLARRRLRGES
jgi:hypothetical protein